MTVAAARVTGPVDRISWVVVIAVVVLLGGCGSRVAAQPPGAFDAVSMAAGPAVAEPEVAVDATPGHEFADGVEHWPDDTARPSVGDDPLLPDAKSAPRSGGARTTQCDWRANLRRATEGRAAEWIVRDTGAWGRAEVPGSRIWIAPRTPCDKVYSVAVHEWTHHMQGVAYGDWGAVLRELAPYGGPEAVADCGALLLGATWIKYGCPHGPADDAAAAILLGLRAGR